MPEEQPIQPNAGVAGGAPEGEPADEETTNRTATVSDLEAFARSDRVETLLEVFERGFSEPLTEDTFEHVRDAGMLLVGAHGFSGLVWLADDREPGRLVGTLGLSEQAEEVVVRFLALWGRRLREALHRSDVTVSRRDDWEAFGRRIVWDPKGEEYVISTEIIKFNGERLHLEAGVASAIRFAERAVSTVLRVPDLRAVSEKDRDEVITAMDDLKGRLTDGDAPTA